MKKIIWVIIIILIILGCIFLIKNDFKKENKQLNSNNNQLEEQIQYENVQNQGRNTDEESVVTSEESIEPADLNVIEEDSKGKNENSENKEKKDISNTVIEEKTEKETNNTIIKEKLSPTGFMGSSLLKVAIYSNGKVYLLKYDGEGYEDSNVIQKELIATNASSIYSKGAGEDFEAIVVKGNSNMQVKNSNYSWIEFEK